MDYPWDDDFPVHAKDCILSFLFGSTEDQITVFEENIAWSEFDTVVENFIDCDMDLQTYDKGQFLILDIILRSVACVA